MCHMESQSTRYDRNTFLLSADRPARPSHRSLIIAFNALCLMPQQLLPLDVPQGMLQIPIPRPVAPITALMSLGITQCQLHASDIVLYSTYCR